MNYNSSVIEYLFDKKLINKMTKVISYDEYGFEKFNNLPNKKNISFAKRYDRYILKRVFSFRPLFKNLNFLLCFIFKCINKFGCMPLSFY